MQDLDLNKIKNIHFIGIGGIGISAVARMMLADGKAVGGQDMQDSEIIADLLGAGADITIGQKYDNIPKGTELVVYTIAIEYYDPELFNKLKQQTDFQIRSYPEMLHVVTEAKYTIAVAGTHGKTTTTAMIGYALREMGKDPSMIVGSLIQNTNTVTQIIENPAEVKQTSENPSRVGAPGERVKSEDFHFPAKRIGTNYWAGKSDLFVVEACEYRRSFLNIKPNILVITNIEADHLDYYKDIADIQSAFHELAMSVPDGGYIICNPNDEIVAKVLVGTMAHIIDYTRLFDDNLKLKIPGLHNKYNAACALTVIEALHFDKSEAMKKLADFPGTWRRFEYKGTLSSGTKVYDDYAHHPTEIKASLQGFRELYPNSSGYKVTVVFQPHLFSRTKSLLDEFAHSFAEADNVLILPIYYAREVDDGTISSHTLSDAIGSTASGYDDFEHAKIYLMNMNLGDKDILVTMGAGEAFKVGDTLLNQ